MDIRWLVWLRRLLDRGGFGGLLVVGTFLLLRFLWLRKRVVFFVCALFIAAFTLFPRGQQSSVSLRKTPSQAQTPMPQDNADQADTPFYTVTDLGTLGGKGSGASAINNKGEVVGSADTPQTSRAYLWRDGTMHDLGAFQDKGSQASDVNDQGQVVGESGARPIFWEKGRLRVMSMLPGAEHSYANAINNQEQVVGTSYDVNSQQARARAVVWDKGTIRNLGLLPSGRYSLGLSINNKGQVVGYAHNGEYWGNSSIPRAFLWDAKKGMRDIGSLGGGEYYDDSFAYAINDQTQIVGVSNQHAFLWQKGKMQDLGLLPGFTTSRANAINNKGQVVGIVTEPRSGTCFMWQNGRMYDLNKCIPSGSGWELSVAYGINDAGQIVGMGSSSQGQARGFLLTPTRH